MELEQLNVNVVPSDVSHTDNVLSPEINQYVKTLFSSDNELKSLDSQSIKVVIPATTEHQEYLTRCGLSLNYESLTEFHQYLQRRFHSSEPTRERAKRVFFSVMCCSSFIFIGLFAILVSIDKWFPGFDEFSGGIRFLILIGIAFVPALILCGLLMWQYPQLKKRTRDPYWYEDIHADVNRSVLNLNSQQTRLWTFTCQQLIIHFQKRPTQCGTCNKMQTVPDHKFCAYCGTLYSSNIVV